MIIGLYGPSRAGKDETAAVLVNHFEFEKRNFANPIRSILLKLFHYVRPDIADAVYSQGWDYVKARFPESVSAMIILGQAMRDDIDEDIWLNKLFKTPYTNIVIPDVRQPNEAERILELGGELWKINREGSKKLGMDGLLDKFEFSATIINNGTLLDLENTVLEIMKGRR